jgi:hypothetical protein
MPQSTRTRPTHSILPARPPLLTPHPPAAPLLPPLHVVDLMTAEGSAAFAATWRVREAKLVECPALGDAMPEFPTTYLISSRMPRSAALTIPAGPWCRRLISADGAAAAWCPSAGIARP